MKFTIPIKPRTKKNHAQLVTLKTGRQVLLPSKSYKEFEKEVVEWVENNFRNLQPINSSINLCCHFYKDKSFRSDLVGYLQAIQDALVKAGLLEDDNHEIVTTTDGSQVFLDKQNPRIEVEITFRKE